MPDKNNSGIVQFASNYIPPLKSDEYTITVSQKLTIDNLKIATDDAVFKFAVDTDFAKAEQGLIYSTYPPKSESGKFGEKIPYVVINRHTFPWEINLFSTEEKLPWVALFVFSQDEGIDLQTGEYGNIIKDKSVVLPDLNKCPKRYSKSNDKCNFIDIPEYLFNSVLPTKEELKYTAHVRKVSLDDKVTDKDVKNGWFACVLSNRHSKTSQGEPVLHNAYLVSLTGYQSYIEKARTDRVSTGNKYRMFSLASWEFFSTENEFNINAISNSLSFGLYSPKVGFDNQTDLSKIINLGHFPVNHTMREGTKTVSFYRPPLIPRKRKNDDVNYHMVSDELLKYDNETSMMDITEQAAWQLGKLLAMENQLFSRELIKWRLINKEKAVVSQNKTMTLKKMNANNIEAVQAGDLIKSHIENILCNLTETCGMSDKTGLDGTNVLKPQMTNQSNGALSQTDLINMYRAGDNDGK